MSTLLRPGTTAPYGGIYQLVDEDGIALNFKQHFYKGQQLPITRWGGSWLLVRVIL